ncbi:MAG: LPS export ABC transporter permease LptG [Deltaproteobacteria bacterium]|nr:MAG: LPS export ABC transporter permease LptG [Deltaproteobacteria bacterium]
MGKTRGRTDNRKKAERDSRHHHPHAPEREKNSTFESSVVPLLPPQEALPPLCLPRLLFLRRPPGNGSEKQGKIRILPRHWRNRPRLLSFHRNGTESQRVLSPPFPLPHLGSKHPLLCADLVPHRENGTGPGFQREAGEIISEEDVISTLKRYFATEFIKIFAFTISGLLLLFHLVDFVEHADNFLARGASVPEVFLYYLYLTPGYFTLLLPYALLVAATVTLVIRSRFNETIAAFASGVSLLSLISPILVTSFVLSLFSFFVSENVTPITSLKARELKATYIKSTERAARFFQNRYWLKSGQALITAQVLDRERATLRGITILVLDEKGNLSQRIDADRGIYRDGWELYDVTVLNTGNGTGLKKVKQLSAPIDVDFESFFSAQKYPQDMSTTELKKYIRELERKGYDTSPYMVDFHARWSNAVLVIVIVFLAAPFALTPSRKGALATSIGIAVFAGFACWGLFSVSLALGRKGVVPPFPAAWAPVLIVALTGAFFYRRMRV